MVFELQHSDRQTDRQEDLCTLCKLRVTVVGVCKLMTAVTSIWKWRRYVD